MMEVGLPRGGSNSTGHLSTIGYHSTGRMHHSASTPAGVDGAGAGPGGVRTPPVTPKKGGKMLAVRVQMLDDTISMFQVQSKALGKVLFDQVCKQLHLLEADYFGLEYQEANGTKYWLDVEKPMCRQVGLSLLEPLLRFCVKFYTPDPARLEEEFTRYLFCLQVKRDLAQGCIQCNENTAALMASYIVQAECGDFVPEDYPDHSYLSGYKFFPGQDAELERRIMENHKKHIGQSPAEADLNLLETARRCELYGMKMHPAKDHENVPLNLSVAHSGIVVFQNFTKINTFSWAKIRKISFKRKRFLIKLHHEGYGYFKEVVEFLFEGRNECKNFWKKCVENHGFFRCSSVKRLPRHKTRVLSRGSSFRYSGKTQKQIVEFVRDNYVRRQTFQRSGSFRASRSLRSSRANVNTPINSSISAHPLLPLPPGSDAISLEWDKQPHYLEASLMMKGYTEEGARAAAARASGARRSLESVPRHQTPTTYVTMTRGPPELVTHAEVNHHHMEDSPLQHRTTTPLASPESTWSRPSSRGIVTSAARDHTQPADTQDPEVSSPGEDDTITSGSFCVSPRSIDKAMLPNYTSTPHDKMAVVTSSNKMAAEAATSCNGLDQIDNKEGDSNKNYVSKKSNGNIVNVQVVSESSQSIDILSGGESDAYDTLSRSKKNSNTISSGCTGTLKGGTVERRRRGVADPIYYIAKELLVTERTYKRDLELVTVSWSQRVSALVSEGVRDEVVEALGRPCLALEPLALPQGAFLARLERCFGAHEAGDEPEYRRVSDLLCEYLTATYEAYSEYTSRAGVLVARLEGARRSGDCVDVAQGSCATLEAQSPLPLACLVLRPLHRVLYYKDLTSELSAIENSEASAEAAALAMRLSLAAVVQLEHAETHAALCQLQRDILGYDKLLVAERELIRIGCLYKHSTKGLQQKMLFLFSDLLLCASKAAGATHFKANSALPLHTLTLTDCQTNIFQLQDEKGTQLIFSAGSSEECERWCVALDDAISRARDNPTLVDTEITTHHEFYENGGTNSGATGSGLAHVCWHRATSLSRDHLYLAMRTQLSGYLLRKFKNSHGWQKLWVVFAAFSLYFYKGWQDEQALASLPLLGYQVTQPNESDNIHKDFVFKLLFKNHVYFFRAESEHTYRRWTEALRTAMVQNINR